MPETRSSANKYDLKYRMYRHEMDEAGHTRLLEKLQRLDGCVALSGYACPLYDERLHDWHRVETAAHADGARPRTEMLWLNAACWQRLEAERGADLFLSLPKMEKVASVTAPTSNGPITHSIRGLAAARSVQHVTIAMRRAGRRATTARGTRFSGIHRLLQRGMRGGPDA
jgi:hypothetical protein